MKIEYSSQIEEMYWNITCDENPSI